MGESRTTMQSREMIGSIEWPNGMGYTPCTAEYEAAKWAADDARDEWREVEDQPRHPEHAARYEAMCRAEDRLQALIAEGGHLGEPVRFERRCAVTAALGGGRVTAAEVAAIMRGSA